MRPTGVPTSPATHNRARGAHSHKYWMFRSILKAANVRHLAATLLANYAPGLIALTVEKIEGKRASDQAGA